MVKKNPSDKWDVGIDSARTKNKDTERNVE
jgi:hypothetical protein